MVSLNSEEIFIKIKIFCASNDIIRKVKNKPQINRKY